MTTTAASREALLAPASRHTRAGALLAAATALLSNRRNRA
jgi:hypothetical protein